MINGSWVTISGRFYLRKLPKWKFPFREENFLSPLSRPSLSPIRSPVFSGRFLGIPATSRYEMGLKIFISSSSTSPYKFYGSILHVGGEITMGKSSKNVDFGSPLPATFPAKLAGTTYWALKPSPPGTQRHRSRPHSLPDGGESTE